MEYQDKKSRVLIVDDEPTIQLTLAHAFGAAGFDVASVGSLGAAREALDQGHFPVVITDLRLSGGGRMEGLDVVRHARQCCPETRVIVLSGELTDELREQLGLLGAMHCYEKPCDINKLLGSVRTISHEAVQ